jgi:hypothetical protein
MFCRFPGTSGDYASTPDNAAFSAMSNFSVMALVSLDDWTRGDTFMAHRLTTGNQRAFTFYCAAAGTLGLDTSSDGTGAGTTVNASTSATGFTDGTLHWVLVTRNSSDGAVKFYTADYVPGSTVPPAIGSFSQLGTTVTGATGATHNSTTVLEVGSSNTGTASILDGDVYRALLYTGIYGSGSESLVRDFRPTDASGTSATSWTSSSTGETWTLNGGDPTLVAETYTKSVAGALTPAGTLAKQAGKGLSGALTPVGALIRQVGQSLTGALAPAGVLARLTGKANDGAITPTGGIANSASKGLAGALTPSGTISSQTGKSLAGGLTPDGALTRQTTKALTGGIAPSGGLGKLIGKALTGALTLAGTLANVLVGGDDPHPITLTLRSRGHTTTVEHDGHTTTVRSNGHTHTIEDSGHTITARTHATLTAREQR